MKIFNNFASGVMNKDLEVRFLPKSIYLDARNVRIFTPESSNSRSVKFPLGNTAVTTLSLGTNAVSCGFCVDGLSNKIYWAVRSDSGSYVCEYDTDDDSEAIVLGDNREASTRVFNFPSMGNIEMRVLNDVENGRTFLFIADGVGEPYYFEIEAAKALPDNLFTLQNVSLIKAPPFTAPTLVLGNTVTSKENNMQVKFLSFAYRYKYTFGEYSAISPFSEFAFKPTSFSFNYGTGTNKSMFNSFSKVDISFDTGSADVVAIDLIVKESGSNTAYVVESFDKANESWSDNTIETFTFSNSKNIRALDPSQLSRVFDNVPFAPHTVELIGNRVIYGNYRENYNIEDSLGTIIYPSLILDYETSTGSPGTAHNQVKSNRDYEVAIGYVDGKGRMTTPITSEGNTTFVLNEDADKKNTLKVSIASKAPAWAEGYRFFIKQSKVNYDVLAPVTFYRDGVYAWIKLEGNDDDKISDGDFIYVKSDTSGLKNSTIRTKVLEIAQKERNFLETDPLVIDGDVTIQREGTYFRVQVDGFSLSEEAVSIYEYTGYAFRSDETTNNFNDDITYIEPTAFYGTGLNDITVSGTYSGAEDIRYEVQVDGTDSPNTFQWRENNVTVPSVGAWTTGVVMTGAAQALSNGISVTFGQITGHTLNDRWVISAKSETRSTSWNGGGSPGSFGRRAIMHYQSKSNTGEETIKSGAVITISYDDSQSDGGVTGQTGLVSETFTSSANYNNLEEWFFEDNIISLMTYPADTSRILFRRGFLTKSDGQEMRMDVTGRMYMCILSSTDYTGGERIRIDLTMTIAELENSIIFETIPVDQNSEIFFELPYTYTISGDNHLGKSGDVNQNFGVTSAEINLDYFNSFGWYNGFESIKIGDTFNEKTMILDTKPLIPIENYQEIVRIASLTYSGVYESSTRFNALNEFNLANVNYKDLDGKYGSIQKLHSKDTDLIVFQEDKTHRVLYSKSVLFNSDGTGNLSQSSDVLGQEIAFVGEYGIGLHPESFGFFGNRIYHLDKARGALMRLSLDGYTEISENGMSDYFRTLPAQASFVGGYDPYNDEYLLNVSADASPLTLSFIEGADAGFSVFYEYQPERLVAVNGRLYSIKTGQLWLHDSNTTRNNFYGAQRTALLTTVFNDSPNDQKHFKSINTESTTPWDISIETPFATGTISANEFELEEGEYYAYFRQNETTDISTAGQGTTAFQGIGNITGININVLSVFLVPRGVSIGDTIYEYDSGTDNVIERGVITGIDVEAGTITVDSAVGLGIGDYILAAKDLRTDGEAIKGYYMKVTLANASSADEELFAVKVEAVRSYD